MTGDLFGDQPAVEPPDGDKGREERGAFYTPDLLALAICRTLFDVGIRPRNILEPGCGGGSFLRAARATWPEATLHGVDLLPACTGPGRVESRDLFTVGVGDYPQGIDLVLGNPDFTIAEKVVRHFAPMLSPAPYGHMALLLLSSFEESRERVPFWEFHPLWLRRAIGAPRPAFRADGQTDMRPYALQVWKQCHFGEYRGLPPLVWK